MKKLGFPSSSSSTTLQKQQSRSEQPLEVFWKYTSPRRTPSSHCCQCCQSQLHFKIISFHLKPFFPRWACCQKTLSNNKRVYNILGFLDTVSFHMTSDNTSLQCMYTRKKNSQTCLPNILYTSMIERLSISPRRCTVRVQRYWKRCRRCNQYGFCWDIGHLKQVVSSLTWLAFQGIMPASQPGRVCLMSPGRAIPCQAHWLIPLWNKAYCSIVFIL